MSARPARPSVLLSELVKLLTLRSVWITLVATAVTCVGMAALTAPSIGEALASRDPDLAPGTTAETVGLEWIGLGLIGVVVVGVVAGSNEYTSGQVKTSLLAVPARLRLVLVKALALFLVTLALAAITIPALSVLAQLGMGAVGVVDGGVPASLTWRWVGGAALWIATAQIGFALGLLLRQTVVPLFVMIVVSQLTLPLVNLVPFAQYLPFSAGVQLYDPAMITASTPAAEVPFAVAAATLLAWTVVFVTAAVIRFRRRDVAA